MINNLPDSFLNSMKNLLNDEYDDFMDSYNKNNFFGLRVNTNKISLEDFEKIAPYNVKKIPFVSNGYYIEDSKLFSKHPYYFAGLYYLQEPSAMLPADRLPVSKNDKVLDLCAAPGGKSTQLICNNPSVLYSNDYSVSRCIALNKNLELFGAVNSYVTGEDPSKLEGYFNEYFDKILVDAPCSGEGMFRKDSSLIASYQKKGPDYYKDIQKGILTSAVKMLKPGGLLMYSTCTFSLKEDEEVIYNLLVNNDDLVLQDIDSYTGFKKGFLINDDYLKYRLDKCVRIFPHLVDGEGHFMALIKKLGNTENSDNYGKMPKHITKLNRFDLNKCTNNKAKAFFANLLVNDSYLKDYSERLFIISDVLYILPEDYECDFRSKIRYIRSGVLVAQIKDNNSFLPLTSFALTLTKENFSNVLNLQSDDERVTKYLKGETIFTFEEDKLEKGYCLILVDGFSLGFGNYDGNKIKNLYEKGWRMT